MAKSSNATKALKTSLFCLVIIILLTTFLIIAEDVLEQQIFDIDIMLQNYVLSIRRDWLTIIFRLITNLANPITLAILSIVILFVEKKQRQNTLALFLNMGLISILNLVLKSFFVRERPDVTLSLISETGYSFPSGHTMLAIAYYGFLIYMIWRSDIKKSKKIPSSIFLGFLILLIAFSRIYLVVHYASDVIGAGCISIVYLMLFILICQKSKIKFLKEPKDFKKHTFWEGFEYAISGIVIAFSEENNLFIQFCVTMLVVVFGVALKFTLTEWVICILLCFLVMVFELVNTAIENLCDKISPDYDNAIKRVKDISAGAVLAMSICAVIVGGIIILPKLQILFV